MKPLKRHFIQCRVFPHLALGLVPAVAAFLRQFVPFQLLEGFGHFLGRFGDLLLDLRYRLGQPAAALDRLLGEVAIAEGGFGRSAGDFLLGHDFPLQARGVLGQLVGQRLQLGQRAALFVQTPLVEPDQGMQAAAHGQGTFRISASLA